MELGKVKEIPSLKKNFIEYQKCVKMPDTIVTPSGVQNWYYAPVPLNMVGAARFIAYEGMTCKRYKNVDLHGGKAQRWLQETGWFDTLEENDPRYSEARCLAKALSKSGSVRASAHFYVLKKRFDLEMKNC